MTALTKARNTPQKDGDVFAFAVAATTAGFAGSIVMLDGGYAKPGATAVGKVAVGRAEADFNNTGAAGAISLEVRRGIFKFANHATDPVLATGVGAECYIADDQTVAATNGTNTRSRAGIVTAIDTDGVWVAMGIGY